MGQQRARDWHNGIHTVKDETRGTILHRKKRFTSFPSSAGMSLTKLPLGRNNSVMTSLFPPRESLVVTSWLGKGNSLTFFLRCTSIELYRTGSPTHGQMIILCTGASLYAPYSLLLISNKFWEWGVLGVGEGLGESFWGPKWYSHIGSMTFHRAEKTLHFQGTIPSHLPTK